MIPVGSVVYTDRFGGSSRKFATGALNCALE